MSGNNRKPGRCKRRLWTPPAGTRRIPLRPDHPQSLTADNSPVHRSAHTYRHTTKQLAKPALGESSSSTVTCGVPRSASSTSVPCVSTWHSSRSHTCHHPCQKDMLSVVTGENFSLMSYSSSVSQWRERILGINWFLGKGFGMGDIWNM